MDCKINMTFLPVKMSYFWFMAAFACMLPYLPVFYTQLGMLVWQIGIIRGLEPIVVFLISPIWGALADKHGKHRLALLIAIAGTGVFYFLIFFVPILSNAVTDDMTVLKNATECNVLDLNIESLEYESSVSMNGKEDPIKCDPLCQAVIQTNLTDLDHLQICSPNSDELNCFRDEQIIENMTETDKEVLFIAVSNCGSNKNGRLLEYIPGVAPTEAVITCEITKCCQCSVQTGVPTSQKQILIFSLCFILAMISVVFNCNILGFLDANLLQLLGDNRKDYGKHRLWGAVGWGVCAFISGAAVDLYTDMTNSDQKRYEPLFIIYLLMIVFTFLVVCNMTFSVHHVPQKMQKHLVILARKPEVLMFLVVLMVEGICFGMSFSHVLIFLTVSLHASHTLIGLSILATCVAEVPMLFLSGWVVKHIGYKGVFYLTLAAYSLRYLGYAVLQNAWWVLAVQLLHGITFGIGWPGFTGYANSIAPKGMAATMQSIMGATYIGIGTAIGNMFGGFIYELFGPRWLFGGTSILCIVTAIFYFIIDLLIISRSTSSDDKTVEMQDPEAINKEGAKPAVNGKESATPEMDGMLNTNQEK